MHIFYTPDISGETVYTLCEEESRHCLKVLRLKAGDEVRLINGKGNLYEARITGTSSKSCNVAIEHIVQEYNRRNFHLHIAIAPTKNSDRFEWFLEKATEIGVDEVTPLICARSERKVVKPERMEKVVIAAMKQSVIAFKPQLNEPVDFKRFIGLSGSLPCKKLIAHCEESDRSHITRHYSHGEDALILIGPEGDFTPEEISLAIGNGFIPVTLGNHRLRTETAGVVACHAFNFLNYIQ